MQILNLLVGCGRVREKVLTIANLAAELIAQRADLLLETLDALTMTTLARLELSLALALRRAQTFELEFGFFTVAGLQVD